MLDVRSLDIDHLLKILGDAAGLTIVKDPSVEGPITIICPRPVSVDDALEILNAVLEVRGFTSVRRGQVLKITTLDKAIQMTTETRIGSNPEEVPPGDRIITQIVPLAALDASQVAAELAPLAMLPESLIASTSTNTLYITDTATNVRRLLGIINEMEQRNAAGTRVFRLEYVSAEEMANLLNEVLAGGAGTAAAPYERRLLPTRGPGGPRAAGAPSARTSAAAAGAGGMQIIPDARTNSLIVMTGPERVAMVESLIAEFDRPVDYSSTLAFIPLQHARADDVADLLSQAFGGAARPAGTTALTPTTRPRTGVTSTQGATSRTTSLQSGQTSENASVVLAGANDGQEPGALLAQAAEAPQQGRTGEGRIVPLIEASEITVIADSATNSIIVNAPPEKLELVRQMVRQLDVVPTQVLIQAIIAEVSVSKRTQLGLEFSLTDYDIFGTGATGTTSTEFGIQQYDSSGELIPTLGLSWSVLKPDRFDGLLNALATDSGIRILSTPRVFTTSGKTATINDSIQVPFATGQFVSDTGGGISTTFKYESVGIVLEVTPLISQDGTVTMEISQTADDLLRFESLSPDLQLPVISKRQAKATVSIQDGYTVVLGGLMTDRVTHTIKGIPLLKDLPLIGWAFRSKDTQREKTELLVFLRPQVVRTPVESQMLTEEQQQQLKELPKIPASPTGPEG
jgi:general secretion pathway protein D